MWRVALVGAIVLASTPARASERNARLVYTGACSAADLVTQVTALIGRDPFTRDGEVVVGVSVEADTSVDVEASRVHATIAIPGARVRTRRLDAASCRDLAEALAFVIVMALADPDPRASTGDRKPDRTTEIPGIGDSRTSIPVRLDAIVGSAASIRLRPQVYLGVRARRGWTSAALELGAELPDSFASGMGQITIARAAATLASCVHRGPFAACATLTAGFFRGRGVGFVASRSAVIPMAVVGGRLAWERPVTRRLSLDVHGEAGVALTRDRFLVDDMVVWTSERFEGRLGISVLARFP